MHERTHAEDGFYRAAFSADKLHTVFILYERAIFIKLSNELLKFQQPAALHGGISLPRVYLFFFLQFSSISDILKPVG